MRESVLSSLRRQTQSVAKQKLTLAALEVIKEDMESLGVSTEILNDNTAAANDLAGVTLTIDFAETSPGTKNFGISDLDQVGAMLRAKGLNKLDVFSLSASLDQNTEVGFTLIEGLGALTKTTSKTIMDKSIFQNLLNRLWVYANDSQTEPNVLGAPPQRWVFPWVPQWLPQRWLQPLGRRQQECHLQRQTS